MAHLLVLPFVDSLLGQTADPNENLDDEGVKLHADTRIV